MSHIDMLVTEANGTTHLVREPYRVVVLRRKGAGHKALFEFDGSGRIDEPKTCHQLGRENQEAFEELWGLRDVV